MTYLYLKDSSVTREPDARSGPSPHLGKEGNDEKLRWRIITMYCVE